MKSFLYHGLGVKGYRHLATRYQKGEIVFELEAEEAPVFPEEGHWVKKGFRWRKAQSLSLGFKSIWLKVKVQRWENRDTGKTFEAPLFLSAKGQKCPKPLSDSSLD